MAQRFGSVALLALGAVMAASAGPAGPGLSGVDESRDQASYPFLDWGREVPPGVSGLRAAVSRYAAVSDCTQAAAEGLRHMAWAALGEEEALRVCLFRIAAGLADPVAFRGWMVGEGFEPGPPQERDSFATYNRPGERVLTETFTWPGGERGDLHGPARGTDDLEGPFLTFVTLAWSEDGLPLSVNLAYQGRFSK